MRLTREWGDILCDIWIEGEWRIKRNGLFPAKAIWLVWQGESRKAKAVKALGIKLVANCMTGNV
jgi:hypothetical protein